MPKKKKCKNECKKNLTSRRWFARTTCCAYLWTKRIIVSIDDSDDKRDDDYDECYNDEGGDYNDEDLALYSSA